MARKAFTKKAYRGSSVWHADLGTKEGTPAQTNYYTFNDLGLRVIGDKKKLANLAATDSGASTALRAITVGQLIDAATGFTEFP